MTKEELKKNLEQINLADITDALCCCCNCKNGEHQGSYCKLASLEMLDCIDNKYKSWELRSK